MGVKLAELLKEERAITVKFGPHELHVTYKLSERTIEKGLDPLEDKSVAVTLSRLITSWDLEQTAGKPVPLTEKGLGKVPVPVLRAIFWRIQGDDGLGEAVSNSVGG